ncbi:MAG: hypothetical protein ABJA71_11150 [Ginsengibacter sp.]
MSKLTCSVGVYDTAQNSWLHLNKINSIYLSPMRWRKYSKSDALKSFPRHNYSLY